MDFVSIDVETANADMSSLCQLGIACYEKNRLIDEWTTLVDPEDDFDFMNILIHGIDAETVRGAPRFPEIVPRLQQYLNNQICVSHTSFDRGSLYQALFKYHFDQMPVTWLDSARVARRTWGEVSQRGWGLADVCKMLGYTFRHHDALADAKAAGHIIIAACDKTGLTITDWLSRVKQPIDPDPTHSSLGKNIEREGNPDGPLWGEVLVFTGALLIHRDEAADLAAGVGCQVDQNVTARTTLLVVGDQDIRKLEGHEKSSKHRKAEDLISKGQQIRILRETDFKAITGLK